MADTETPAADATKAAAPAAKATKSKATIAVHPVNGAPGTDDSVVEMVTVETTGDFQLMDVFTNTLIPHDHSVEVAKSQFIKDALEDGRLIEA